MDETGVTYPIPEFREDRPEILATAIDALQFGLLVTDAQDRLTTSYLPWEFDARRGVCGTLVGHLARYNPQWRVPDDGMRALVVFQGPHGYISPAWYPGTRTDPRQVPTWDYLTVEVRGTLRPFEDEARLYRLLVDLTERNERGRPGRWHVDDAPDDYIRGEMRHIVGIEVVVDSIIGGYKLSQNRTAADRDGAVRALSASPAERDRALARAIAAAASRGSR